jgi:DNA-binding transcriptional MerR regulator
MGALERATVPRLQKSASAFRTISEVSAELDVPQHVLRFWETKFTQVRPLKRGGGRRYYRPEDVELLSRIRELLYRDGYTIKGVQRLFRSEGTKAAGAVASRPALAAVPSVADPVAQAPAGADLTALQAALRDLVEIRDLLNGALGPRED